MTTPLSFSSCFVFVFAISMSSRKLANLFNDFRLTTDATVRKLNSRYRLQNKSTDILSFPLHEQKGAPGTLPEVMIAILCAAQFFLCFLSNHIGTYPFSKVLFVEEMELGEMVISMPYVFCVDCCV